VAEPPGLRSQAEPGNERWSAFALSLTAMGFSPTLSCYCLDQTFSLTAMGWSPESLDSGLIKNNEWKR